MDMKNAVYRHYGAEKFDRNIVTKEKMDPMIMKPAGLWGSPMTYEKDDEEFIYEKGDYGNKEKWGDFDNAESYWAWFCRNEDFRIGSLNIHFDFTVKPEANILVVNKLDDIRHYLIGGGFFYQLDRSILNDYDGLFVNAFSGEIRNVFMSYDVPSIVVWNYDMVEEIDIEKKIKAAVERDRDDPAEGFNAEDHEEENVRIRYIDGPMPFDRADETGFGLVHATGREVYDPVNDTWYAEYENSNTVELPVTEEREERDMKDIYGAMHDTAVRSADNMTLTENGAVTYISTGSPLVDLDASIAELRNRSENDIKSRFGHAYALNSEAAVKWLFYAGDIREGKGERRLFNIGMDYLNRRHPDVVIKMLPLIPEYTRWDYATRMILSRNPEVKKAALELVTGQFRADLDAVKKGESASLLGKWLPSAQTKIKEDRGIMLRVKDAMGMDFKEYRKALSQLRGQLHVIEKALTARDYESIDMAAMTSKQNLIYGNTLAKNCPELRNEFLKKVSMGEETMNADVLFPHDIVHKYDAPSIYNENYESLWKALPDMMEGNSDMVVIRDGSYSMTSRLMKTENSPTCLDLATSLAIYCAERQTGPMHDKYITFSAEPKIVDMSDCSTLMEKLELSYMEDDCSNTNIEKTFDLLLEALQKAGAAPDEAPGKIMIISDMEFDSVSKGGGGWWNTEPSPEWTKSLFDELRDRWKEAGYEMPTLVFWQANARRTLTPMIDNDRGIITLSGFSTNTLGMVMRGEFEREEVITADDGQEVVKKVVMTPEEQLSHILSKERYAAVGEAFEEAMALERSPESALHAVEDAMHRGLSYDRPSLAEELSEAMSGMEVEPEAEAVKEEEEWDEEEW